MIADTENIQSSTRNHGVTKRYNTRNRSKKTALRQRKALGDISNKRTIEGGNKNKKVLTKRRTRQSKPVATRRNPARKTRATKPTRSKGLAKRTTNNGVTTRVTRSSSRRAAAASKKTKRKSTGFTEEQKWRKRSKTEDESDPFADTMNTVEVSPSLSMSEDEKDIPPPNTVQRAQIAEIVSMMDQCDVDNPFALSQYAEDIYTNNRAVESKTQTDGSYMERQCEITPRMRQKLIDWLIDLHKRFKLEPETLYLGINCLDRYLSKETVYKSNFQLVGCTALLLSSKYEEIYPPVAQDFVYMSANAFTREELLQMETHMLNTLGFNLTVPSILHFSQRFLKVVGVRPDQDVIRQHVNFLMEFTLEHYNYSEFNYSKIAACACYMALCMAQSINDHKDSGFQVPSAIPKQLDLLMQYSGYSLEDLMPCFQLYKKLLATPPRYMAVRRKFTTLSANIYSEMSDTISKIVSCA